MAYKRRSLAHYQFRRFADEMHFAETDAMAAKGRCQSQLTAEAFALVEGREKAECYDVFDKADFWTKIESGLSDGGAEALHEQATARPAPTLYDLARQAVKVEREWCWGHPVEIWHYKTYTATVSYGGSVGDLWLTLSNGAVQESIRCARLPMFVTGIDPASSDGQHVWTLTEADYKSWAEKARQI